MSWPDFSGWIAARSANVRKRGGDEALKSLGIYNDGRMYKWSAGRGRGYTAYVAETPAGELVEIH